MTLVGMVAVSQLRILCQSSRLPIRLICSLACLSSEAGASSRCRVTSWARESSLLFCLLCRLKSCSFTCRC